MEKLRLPLKEDIPCSVYVSPSLLGKKPSYGAITLENEEEIILVSPQKITVKEQEQQTDLIREEIRELETKLSHYKLSLLNSLFRSGKKSQDLTNLKLEMIRLRAESIT